MVGSGVCGDGAAMAGEVVVAGKLVDDGLEIGRGLRASQEGCSNRSDGLGPRLEVVPAGNGRDGLAVQETTTKAEEMGTTDAQTGGGLGGVDRAGVEVVEGAMDEFLGQSMADLALFAWGHTGAAPGSCADGGNGGMPRVGRGTSLQEACCSSSRPDVASSCRPSRPRSVGLPSRSFRRPGCTSPGRSWAA